MAFERLDRQVMIRFTCSQWDRVRERAGEAGYRPATWLRQLVVENTTGLQREGNKPITGHNG